MKYTRSHEVILYALGLAGFLGLFLAGACDPPGAVWLRGAALLWFIGLGLVRCLALLTLRPEDERGRAGQPVASGGIDPERPRTEAVGPPPKGPGRPWD